jgi:hypothetical protein
MLLQVTTESTAPTSPSASKRASLAHQTAKVAERELPKRTWRPSAKAASGDPFSVAEPAEMPAYPPGKQVLRSRAGNSREGADKYDSMATSGNEEDQAEGEGNAPPLPNLPSSIKRKVMPAACCGALMTIRLREGGSNMSCHGKQHQLCTTQVRGVMLLRFFDDHT